MTTQMLDAVLYNEMAFGLFAMQGGDLFTPQQVGMTPEMLHTGCYRGFYVTYLIGADQLFLHELTLREAEGRYVPIDGCEPLVQESKAAYRGMRVPVRFTGKFRIGKGFFPRKLPEPSRVAVSDRATVLDVTLSQGRVIAVEDRSEDVACRRAEAKEPYRFADTSWIMVELIGLDAGVKWVSALTGR